MKYYVNGRPVRESTGVDGDGETAPAETRRFLKGREGRVANGEPMLPRTNRVRYQEAVADLRQHYATTRARGLDESEGRLKHLDAFFTGYLRIDDFRKAWATACELAGVPGRLRHDFRRTAVRNMERTGAPRSVATKLTGHKTEAVYHRYAIVSDADLKAASLRLDGHNSGHSDAAAVDSRSLTR